MCVRQYGRGVHVPAPLHTALFSLPPLVVIITGSARLSQSSRSCPHHCFFFSSLVFYPHFLHLDDSTFPPLETPRANSFKSPIPNPRRVPLASRSLFLSLQSAGSCLHRAFKGPVHFRNRLSPLYSPFLERPPSADPLTSFRQSPQGESISSLLRHPSHASSTSSQMTLMAIASEQWLMMYRDDWVVARERHDYGEFFGDSVQTARPCTHHTTPPVPLPLHPSTRHRTACLCACTIPTSAVLAGQPGSRQRGRDGTQRSLKFLLYPAGHSLILKGFI